VPPMAMRLNESNANKNFIMNPLVLVNDFLPIVFILSPVRVVS